MISAIHTVNSAESTEGGSAAVVNPQQLQQCESSHREKEPSDDEQDDNPGSPRTPRQIQRKNVDIIVSKDNDNAKVEGIMKRGSSAKKHQLVHLPRLRVRRRQRLYSGAVHSFSSGSSDEEDPLAAAASAEDLSVTGNWSIDDDASSHRHHPVVLTEHDIAMCRALDLEYDRALEDRQVAWTARYQSVRQSTLLSILFMVLLIMTGTIFFLHQADSYWNVSEALLFSIYTITTVGYGHLDMPDTPAFQIYTICYIFLGIAMLTILVAQVYQCVALEASRVAVTAGDAQARRNFMRLWIDARMKEKREATNQQRHQQREASVGEHALADLDNSSSSNYPFGDALSSSWGWTDIAEWILQRWDTMRTFLRDDEIGRGLSVILPFAILIAIGAVVIGPLEGWTAIESIYFSVVSLTTVGFGDYYPTRKASIWFCIVWLPFSVGFMSLYLANVAAFYIRMSDRNVARIERILRRRMQRAKERAEHERRSILRRALRGQLRPEGSQQSGNSSDEDLALATEAANQAADQHLDVEEGVKIVTLDRSESGLHQTANRLRGFKTIPTLEESNHDRSVISTSNPNGMADDSDHQRREKQDISTSSHLFGMEGSASHRRDRILRNCLKLMDDVPHGENRGRKQSAAMTMATMKDVLRTVRCNNSSNTSNSQDLSGGGNVQLPRKNFQAAGPESEFLSVRSRTVLNHDRMTVRKKPSFALRALVQERFAEIIATDIAGYQSGIEIKEYTLSVTIESLKQTADKWSVPRRARKAFRAVAFEALYFVGEHGLITRGADALFSLTPFEFHQLFSPLLAAFGDAEAMELWLEHTQALADVDIVSTVQQPPPPRQQLNGKTEVHSKSNVASSKSTLQHSHIVKSDTNEMNGVTVLRRGQSVVNQAARNTSLPSATDEEKVLPDIS